MTWQVHPNPLSSSGCCLRLSVLLAALYSPARFSTILLVRVSILRLQPFSRRRCTKICFSPTFEKTRRDSSACDTGKVLPGWMLRLRRDALRLRGSIAAHAVIALGLRCCLAESKLFVSALIYSPYARRILVPYTVERLRSWILRLRQNLLLFSNTAD